jgi:hypothetical protein
MSIGNQGSSSRLAEGFQSQQILGLTTGWSSHHALDAVPEDSAVLRKDSRRFSTGGVPAGQQQQGGSSSSSRRLSLGAAGVGVGRGLRVLAPGRLRVAAMAKAQQQRRQSTG